MKIILLPLASLLWASLGLAQGTLIFNNRVLGNVDARVLYENNGDLIPADSRFVAQLYASAPGLTLAPVGAPVAFRDVIGAGYINPGGRDLTRTVPGVNENGTAQFKMVAWAVSLGSTYESVVSIGRGGFGESQIVGSVRTGGGLNPPTPLVGLQGFTISTIAPVAVPEAGNTALLAFGLGLLIALRRSSNR